VNISEIVAQKHLLARITALEIAVAALEAGKRDLVAEIIASFDVEAYAPNTPILNALKRKPGRPRKNA
jgi:hypothetical protein